jgi:hypothetical protein
MRRALWIYVASALLVALALFIATGVKVYADWSDEPKAMTTGTPPVSQGVEGADPNCSILREGVKVPCTPENLEWSRIQEEKEPPPPPPPPEPNPPKPTVQEGHESCLWYRGKIRWCLIEPTGEEWYIESKPGGRYVFSDLTHGEALGYLRPTSYGWRAMNIKCFKGPRPCAWARGGWVVRVSRNVLRVHSVTQERIDADGSSFSEYKGRKVETARGPHAIAVALYRLAYGDCRYVRDSWEEPLRWKPCRRGVGQ